MAIESQFKIIAKNYKGSGIMGTDYYIVNHKTKKIFELGRGFWWDWYIEDGIEYLFDKDLCIELLCHLVDEIYNYSALEEREKAKKYYSGFVVPKLYEFVKNAEPKDIQFFSDGSNEFDEFVELQYEKLYTYFGTRYTSDYDENDNFIIGHHHYYLEDSFINRHKNKEKYLIISNDIPSRDIKIKSRIKETNG